MKLVIPIALLSALGLGTLSLFLARNAPAEGQGATPADEQALMPAPECRKGPFAHLPPLDLSDMRLWNYAGKWHPSEWENNFSYVPWRADHVRRLPGGDVTFVLDEAGGAELKSEAGTPAALRGYWEVEVTLPELRDGMVAAPLWLYNQKLKQEIDFEFAGRRSLDVTIHAYPDGTHHSRTIHLFKGADFSHCTLKLAIRADIPAGWAEMYVEDRLAYRFTREQLGYFPTGEVRPIISIWSARDNHPGFVAWLGRWQPLPAGQSLVMTIHGYRARIDD